MDRAFIKLLILLFVMTLATSCTVAGDDDAPATPPPNGVNSPQAQSLLGRWAVNHERFGNAIFEFRDDGTLTIENVDTGQVRNMAYVFVDDDTIALTGDREFAGTAKIEVSGNKMAFVITFTGNVFGEIYPSFTRVEGETAG